MLAVKKPFKAPISNPFKPLKVSLSLSDNIGLPLSRKPHKSRFFMKKLKKQLFFRFFSRNSFIFLFFSFKECCFSLMKWLQILDFLFISSLLLIFPLELAFSYQIIGHQETKLFLQVFSLFMLFFEAFQAKNKPKTSLNLKILIDFIAILPFFLPEPQFLKLFFVFLKFPAFIQCFDAFISPFRLSIAFRLLSEGVLVFHWISCSWLVFIGLFDKGEQQSWTGDLNIEGVNSWKAYCLALRWAFHVFFPVFSINFPTHNEYEAIFEVLSVISACFYYILNAQAFVFLLKGAIYPELEILEKNEFLTNLIRKTAKKGQKLLKIKEKALEMAGKANISEEININPALMGIREEARQQFLNSIITPIVFHKLPFLFKNFSPPFLKKVLNICKLCRFAKGDNIIEETSFQKQTLSFIITGSVVIFSKPVNRKIAILHENDHFGEFSFSSLMPERYSYKAEQSLLLMQIQREDFVELLKQEKHEYEKLHQIKDALNIYNSPSRLHLPCPYCSCPSHILQTCPRLHVLLPQRSPTNKADITPRMPFFPRKKRPKFASLKLGSKLKPLEKTGQIRSNTKKISFFNKKATFLSSGMGGSRTQREPLSFERMPSNFSSIKKNATQPQISASSMGNEILMLNCMNSPLALKKMAHPQDDLYNKGATFSHTSPKLYNDVNESNRVYYDHHGETIQREERFESVTSQRSRFSEKVPQFKSETNRTSEIIDEYSDLMSKTSKSKYKKQTNPSQNSQPFSSYTNFDQGGGFTNNSSKNPKENRSSRYKQTNYEKKLLSSNSILTQTQQVFQNYLEKLSKTLDRSHETHAYPPPDQEFEVKGSFKHYFPENNLENIVNSMK